MLKILHAGFQQYMNQELPDIQAGFRKGRGTRDQIAWGVQFQDGVVQGPDRGDGCYFRNFQNIQSDVLFFHSFICLESQLYKKSKYIYKYVYIDKYKLHFW